MFEVPELKMKILLTKDSKKYRKESLYIPLGGVAAASPVSGSTGTSLTFFGGFSIN